MKRRISQVTAFMLIMALWFTPITAHAQSMFSVVQAPAFTFMSADRAEIASGGNITFTMRTTNAQRVTVDVDNQTISATQLGTDTTTGEISWAATARPTQAQTITVTAHGAGGRIATFTQPVIITSSAPPSAPPTVQNVTTNPQARFGNQSIYSVREIPSRIANHVRLEVITGITSNYVWVRMNHATGPRYNLATMVGQTSTHRVWEVGYNPGQMNLLHQVQVSANRAYIINGAVNLNVAVTGVPLAGPGVPVQGAQILSASMQGNQRIVVGDDVQITVRTNINTTHVWAVVDGQRVNARRTSGAGTTAHTWIVTVRPQDPQEIIIFANTDATDTGAVTRGINVNPIREDVRIISSRAEWNTARTEIQVTVVTNRAAEWVELNVPGRRGALDITDQRNTSANETTWTAFFTPTHGWNSLPIEVVAGGDSSRAARETISQLGGDMQPMGNTPFIDISGPLIRNYGGNVIAHWTITTTRDVNSVQIRALDIPDAIWAQAIHGQATLNPEHRQWNVSVVIGTSGFTHSRFEIHAIGSVPLQGGRHITGIFPLRPF